MPTPLDISGLQTQERVHPDPDAPTPHCYRPVAHGVRTQLWLHRHVESLPGGG